MSDGILFLPDWRISLKDKKQQLEESDQHYLFVSPELLSEQSEPLTPTNIRVETLSNNAEHIDKNYTEIVDRMRLICQSAMDDTSKPKLLLQVFLPISSQDAAYAYKGLSGFIKTATKESSRIFGQIVFLDHIVTIDQLINIAKENTLPSASEAIVKYVGHNRYIGCWKEHKHISAACPWQHNGTYIITGGLGGLGILFAEDIATKVNSPTLYLTGRSQLSKDLQGRIDNLANLGATIYYRSVDVCSRDEVDALMASIKHKTKSINGIIHSAGVLHDSFLRFKTEEDVTSVLAPKVSGIVNLDLASRDILNGYLLAFSSASAALGNIGQSDYAAANAFMDAYSDYRNSVSVTGKPQARMLSINWPLWRDGGMQVNPQNLQALHSVGLSVLENSQGINACYQAIASGKNQVLVLSGNVKKIRELIKPSNNVKYRAKEQESLPQELQTSKKHNHGQTQGNNLEEKTINFLKELVKDALKVPSDRIDALAPLEKYGIDSIMVMDITRSLEKEFGILSKTLMFEYQSIAELSEYFLKNHKKDLSGLFSIDQELPQIDNTSQTEFSEKTENPKTRKSNTRKHTKKIRGKRFYNKNSNTDIAIIGLSAKYPKANNQDELWENLVHGKNCITEIPEGRWDHSRYFHPNKNNPETTYTKWGGFIDNVSQFDALFFNISPREAARLDPQERLFLQSAYETIEDAGYTRDQLANLEHSGLRGNVGVYVGVMYNEYQLYGAQAQSNDQLLAVAASTASIANRVSYYFNLHGPSMVVDTMCSSSLTSIHLACESLRSGGCAMAIAGGVNLSLHPNKYLLLGQGKLASTKGLCESFGEGGDGYVPAEGVGSVLLKPLDQAVADNDQIYGVINGSSINHGGKTNGYTVPNPNAQANIISHALNISEVDPRTISYIEAHGTGTALGDPIEITGLRKAFEKGTQDKQFCSIGSIKSNIGHCESAAGIAGLTKVLLQLKYKKLVPSLHAQTTNPNIQFDNTPFKVQTELQNWEQPIINGKPHPRRAGISAFGAGGSNAHIIVSEYSTDLTKHAKNSDCPAVITLSAKKPKQLNHQVARLLAVLDNKKFTDHDIENIAYTLQVGREAMNYKAAFVTENIAQLKQQLQAHLNSDENTPGYYWGKITPSISVKSPSIDVESMTKQNNWDELAQHWIKGGVVDWEILYKKHRPQIISLPSYAFADTRYWITMNNRTEKPTNQPLHPFIQEKINGSSGTRFRSIFNGTEFFLADHRVNNTPIFPGAAYIEMAYQAVNQILQDNGERPFEVVNLIWLRPLIILSETQVFIDLEKNENGWFKFEVSSATLNSDSEPTIHCKGEVRLFQVEPRKTVNLHALQADCNKKTLESDEIYGNFKSINFQYGPAHQGLSRFQLGNKSVFAVLNLPHSVKSSAAEFRAHPSMVDAAFQSTMGLPIIESFSETTAESSNGDKTNSETVLPFRIKSICSSFAIPAQAWAWLRHSDDHNPNSSTSKVDIDICDKNGEICVSIKGYISRILPTSNQSPEKTESPQITETQTSIDQTINIQERSSDMNDKQVETSAVLAHIETVVIKTVCRLLEIPEEDIETDTELNEYGFDSVSFTKFSNDLNEQYSLDLTPTIFFEYPSIEAFSEHLAEQYGDRFVTASRQENTSPSPQPPQETPEIEQQSQISQHADEKKHEQNHNQNFDQDYPLEPIAIIGMSGRFPEADNLDVFWQNLVDGKDCISEVPTSRWDWKALYGDPKTEPGKTNIKWGGFMNGLEEFDPLFFGISPREALGMDPQQRLLMTYVWKAIEDAGYAASSLSGSDLALLIGTAVSGYGNLVAKASATVQGYHATAAVPSIGPNRMSFILDVHGPSEPVETACSSSLVAVHKALQLLRTGQSEMAVVGGVNTLVTQAGHISFGKAGMLSEDGRCKTFSSQANGYVRGEGVGMLVLKPLSLAKRDGDNIHALIRGSAQNHGGRSQSLTAPNTKAQASLLKNAYRDAGIDMSTISYIEAHGTGTSLGDPIEIDGLKSAFSEDKVLKHCGIGSVKTNIGHLELSAGVAGVIKTVLQLKHKTLVKSLHCDDVNPYIKLENSPFYIVDKKQDWHALKDSDGRSIPRRAGVSSFGFGGVNAHVILEEYSADEPLSPTNETPQCFILSAKTKNVLRVQAEQLLTAINSKSIKTHAFNSLAYTLQIGRDAMDERLAFVANNLQDVQAKLSVFLRGESDAELFLGRSDRKTVKLPPLTVANNYIELMSAWVSGRRVDWLSAYSSTIPKRISCPTYPFEYQSYWISSVQMDTVETQVPSPVVTTPAPVASQRYAVSENSGEDIKTQCLNYLKNVMSQVLDIPTERLEADRSFSDYGVDSIVVVNFAENLNKTFSSLDSSILFDYQTLGELVDYLMEHEENALNTLFEKSSPPIQTAAENIPATPQTHLKNQSSEYNNLPMNEKPAVSDIAIIGLTARYAQADNVAEFWENLKAGKNCITEIPQDRWDWRQGFSEQKGKVGSIYTKWGGFINDADKFDPMFFSITPRDAEWMDPQERVFVEAAHGCIEDAGYTPKSLDPKGKVGVFCGVMNGNYSAGVRFWSIPNRVSYLFDFKGPSLAIDSACSSSLSAINTAIESLKNGSCNVAIAGGVNIIVDPAHYRALSAATMLSTSDECSAFGTGADGFVDGEGVGTVLLKPLWQAEQDGDHIYGVIKSCSLNAGGKTSGFTVPSVSAQAEVVTDSYKRAGIDPTHMDYIEAHGTGTPLGDPIEISGLTRAYRAFTPKVAYCALGSVKPNIGHTESAAGVAGLTKILLQFKHQQLVPSLHSKEINPRVKLDGSPFVVQQTLSDWARPTLNGQPRPRLAALSSFGAGGANAHLVVEEYYSTDIQKAEITTSPHLIILSAKSPEQLKTHAKNLLATIKNNTSIRMTDLAYTLQVGRVAMNERLAFVAQDRNGLLSQLACFLDDDKTPDNLHQGSANNPSSMVKALSEGPGINGMINTWIEQHNWEQLLTLWVEGVTLDWTLLHSGKTTQRISLPTYPFARERYWVYKTDTTGKVRLTGPIGYDPAEYDANKHVQASPKTGTTAVINKSLENSAIPDTVSPQQEVFYISPYWAEANVETASPEGGYHAHHILLSSPFAENINQLARSNRRISLFDHESLQHNRSLQRSENFSQAALQILGVLQKALRECAKGPVLVQIVVDSESGSHRYHGLSGMLRTARKENPKLTTQLIELNASASPLQLAQKIEDNSNSPKDLHIRHSENGRKVARWNEVLMKNPATMPWKSQGCYLITGGAGGLGYLFADDIIRQTRNVNLILTGRSPLNSQIQTKLDQLRNLGAQVEYHVADVCSSDSVSTLMNHIRQTYGKLNGIIHSAGQLQDGFILNKTPEDFSSVLSPKVKGTLNLDEASKELLDGVFILFGSNAGAFGNVGQVDYACANAFMDGFAENRKMLIRQGQRLGHTLTIDWPLWRDGGMQVDSIKLKMLDKVGLHPLENNAGIQACYHAIACGEPQVAVLSGNLQQIRKLIPTENAQETTTTETPVSTNRNVTQPSPVTESDENNHASDTADIQLIAETYVKKILTDVVKLPAEKIGVKISLEEYGVDSIASTQITNVFEKDLGVLSKTVLFEYPTVAQIANFLVDEHKDDLLKLGIAVNSTNKPSPSSEQKPNRAATPEVNEFITKPKKPQITAHSTQNKLPNESDQDQDIAIVGLAGSYPEAESLDIFWNNLTQGKDCVSEIPKDRWDHDSYFGDGITPNGGKYCKWGGFMKDMDKFDPLFFKISPREATAMDPQERLFLQCAYHAIEDAGYTRESIGNIDNSNLPRKIGVYAGASYFEYQMYAAQAQILGNPVALFGTPASIANRVSYHFNFNGPSMTVDTMCSSSLTSIHLASESLRTGNCSIAIAGGVNLCPHPNKYMLLGQSNFTATEGRCQAFGTEGDGYVPSEGVGVVVLKSLRTAIADGDKIYGVIKSSSINHGGKASGFTVPNPAAQARVIADAMNSSTVNPRDISYLEAHGTGTILGDPIEISGLSQAFRQHTNDKQFCAIGSVKSNIGHCESAAGIAGLTKILLQMKHKTLVPSIHCDELNPKIDFDNSPFQVQRELCEWKNERDENQQIKPLTAGLSSFGAGGSNAHLIVTEYLPEEGQQKELIHEVDTEQAFILSARTPERLQEHATRILTALESAEHQNTPYSDIVHTLQVSREAMLCRIGFIAATRQQAIEKLRSYLQLGSDAKGLYAGRIYPAKDAARIDTLNRESAHDITQWIAEKSHLALIQIWIEGADVNWLSMYQHNSRNRITLPFYPFEKERCWITMPTIANAAAAINTAKIVEQPSIEQKPEEPALETFVESLPTTDSQNDSVFDVSSLIDKVNLNDMPEDEFLEWIAEQ